MSVSQVIRLTCPHCHKTAEDTIYTQIDAQKDKAIARQVTNGQLFWQICPHCGQRIPLSYGCIYENHEKQFMVSLVPGIRQETAREAAEELKLRILDDAQAARWRLRLVPDANALVEKVRLFERGRDDRLMELCKYHVWLDVRQQYPDVVMLALYYEPAGDGEKLTVLCKDRAPLAVPLSDEMLQAVRKTYNEVLLAEPAVFCVDAFWAAEILNKKNR